MTATTPVVADLGVWALPDLADVPDLPEFDTYYGVKLSPIGEDGEVVILGHVGELRALAALRAWLRYCEGANRTRRIEDPTAWTRTNQQILYDDLDHRYAVVLTHCNQYPNCGPETGDPIGDEAGKCWRCAEIAGCAWWLKLSVDADTPGAFPVTYWSV